MKINKIKKIVPVILLLGWFTPFQVQAQNFQVSGTKILDPEGNEFIAKGVNVGGYNYNKSAGNTLEDIDLILDVWQFNLVRVNCKMFYNQYNYGFTENNDMKAIINAFTARKCVVLIDGGHEKIGSFYEGEELDSLVRFYQDLASYSIDNPYVWFDLANEPDNNYARAGDKNRWTGMMQTLIKAVRETGNENVILVCGGSWGQDAGGGGCDNVPEAWSHILSWHQDVMNFEGTQYQNIAFTFHVYNSWNCSRARLADYFTRVADKNLAIIVGEYGSENEDKSTIKATRYMFDICQKRNIGRVVWHWSNGDDNDLVKKVAGTTRGTNNNGGGREINHLVSPTNLTELGTLIWQDNHNTLTGVETEIPEGTGQINIRFTSPHELAIHIHPELAVNGKANFALYNMSGQKLFNHSFQVLNEHWLSLGHTFLPGLYLARLNVDQVFYTQKLLLHY